MHTTSTGNGQEVLPEHPRANVFLQLRGRNLFEQRSHMDTIACCLRKLDNEHPLDYLGIHISVLVEPYNRLTPEGKRLHYELVHKQALTIQI